MVSIGLPKLLVRKRSNVAVVSIAAACQGFGHRHGASSGRRTSAGRGRSLGGIRGYLSAFLHEELPVEKLVRCVRELSEDGLAADDDEARFAGDTRCGTNDVLNLGARHGWMGPSASSSAMTPGSMAAGSHRT